MNKRHRGARAARGTLVGLLTIIPLACGDDTHDSTGASATSAAGTSSGSTATTTSASTGTGTTGTSGTTTGPGGGGGGGQGGSATVGGTGGSGGAPVTLSPVAEWSMLFSATTFADAAAVAVDPGGTVVVAGSFSGTMTIGATTLVSTDFDAFVAWFDGAGTLLDAVAIDDPDPQVDLRPSSIAVSPAGIVSVTGVASGGGFQGPFLTTVDPSGAILSHQTFPATFVSAGGVASDGAFAYLCAGVQNLASKDVGCGVMTMSAGYDILFAKFDLASGACALSDAYGWEFGAQYCRDVVLHGDDVYLAGKVDALGSETEIGGVQFPSILWEAYVAKLDTSTLVGSWIGGAEIEFATGASISAAGEPLAYGRYLSAQAAWGLPEPVDFSDFYFARLDPATGSPTAVTAFGRHGDDGELRGAAPTPSGGAWVVGFETGPGLYGDLLLEPAGTLPDALVVAFDAQLGIVRAGVYGDDDDQEALDVATDAAGAAYVVGELQGTIDFGTGPITSNPPAGFFVKLAPP